MDGESIVDALGREAFGLTRESAWDRGICIRCEKPATFRTAEGRREYRISAICEPCFDRMFKEDNDG